MTYWLDGIKYSREFVATDAGRATSKRSKQKNDCGVRALALALNCPYDTAYGLLAEAGRKSGHGTEELRILDALNSLGIGWIRHSFPAIKGQRRVNPISFPERFPVGRFIVRTAKHYFAYIDGVAHDASPSDADRCIYGAIEVGKC